jgi:hypothetical protein
MTRARRPQGHQKSDQLPPLGKRRSARPTVNSTSSNLTIAVFVSAVMSPSARKCEAETIGRSSIAVLTEQN